MRQWGLFLLGLMSLLLGQTVHAHGGGTLQIVNAPIAEAYRVSVWSAPTTIRAQDDIHITVGVADQANGGRCWIRPFRLIFM